MLPMHARTFALVSFYQTALVSYPVQFTSIITHLLIFITNTLARVTLSVSDFIHVFLGTNYELSFVTSFFQTVMAKVGLKLKLCPLCEVLVHITILVGYLNLLYSIVCYTICARPSTFLTCTSRFCLRFATNSLVHCPYLPRKWKLT